MLKKRVLSVAMAFLFAVSFCLPSLAEDSTDQLNHTDTGTSRVYIDEDGSIVEEITISVNDAPVNVWHRTTKDGIAYVTVQENGITTTFSYTTNYENKFSNLYSGISAYSSGYRLVYLSSTEHSYYVGPEHYTVSQVLTLIGASMEHLGLPYDDIVKLAGAIVEIAATDIPTTTVVKCDYYEQYDSNNVCIGVYYVEYTATVIANGHTVKTQTGNFTTLTYV